MPREGEGHSQSSVWSVPLAWARVYSVLFFLIGAFGVGRLVWLEVAEGGSPTEVVFDVVVGAGKVGIGAASLGVILVIGGDLIMVLSTWVSQRQRAKGREEGREEGLEEGREEGLEEGREEGLEEGREEAHTLWEAWNRRRLEAEAKDEPFDEPPPQPTNGRSTT